MLSFSTSPSFIMVNSVVGNSLPKGIQLQLQLQLYFIRLLVTIDWPAKLQICFALIGAVIVM